MRGDLVTYVGHASTLIEVDGTRLLTDPVLRTHLGHIRRIAALPSPETGKRVDAILISHAHHDHLDIRSLRALPATRVFAPPGCARIVRRWTHHDAVEVVPGTRL